MDDAVAPDIDELRDIGRSAGLVAVGVAPADPMDRARAILHERKAAGLNATMAFTYKNPDRSCDPRATFPWANTLVVGARAYNGADVADPPTRVGDGHHSGRVARYASRDTYADLHTGLNALARRLRRSGFRATVVADENHLVDREAAYLAGVGWYGKNANILIPSVGSWVVLGSVVTSALLRDDHDVVPDGCGSCRRCLDACPTGAIVAPGVVDARRCLAWLVQAPGVFPVEYRRALGARLYGCDDCQEVCPPNRVAVRRAEGEPHSANLPIGEPWIDLVELLAADDATLLARHGRWYLADRQTRTLRRNALVALANCADPADEQVRAAVASALRHHDALVRAHAVWAAVQLGYHDLLALVDDDPDPMVRAERRGDAGASPAESPGESPGESPERLRR